MKYFLLSVFMAALLPRFAMNEECTDTEVTLERAPGHLAGTLLIPNSNQPVPVVLIIAGSGPTDRNGNQPGMINNSLKLLAEGLCSEGIATLRIDKRGVGGSASAARVAARFCEEYGLPDIGYSCIRGTG